MEMVERLSSFIVETNYGIFPSKCVELCKRNILDFIAVSLAGTKTRVGEIIREFVTENGGSNVSGIIGAHRRSSPPMAALANGTIAHALDYDDHNPTSIAHPSVSILPAILAVGEKERISGRKLIEAYVIGYEIEDRMGLCVNPEHYELGWHTTGTLGTFGALAAVSKILELNEEQIRMAFGLGASLMGGTRKNFGTMTKPLHAGNSAKNGIIAASLAKKGFSSNREILEGPMGIIDLFSGKKDVDLSRIARMLGNPFAIVSPGTLIKPYPCGGLANGAIEALLDIIKDNDVSKEDIKKVECGVHYRVPQAMIYQRPKTGLEGKFSLEYCLAVAIIDKKVVLDQFTDQRVNDPCVREMLDKITVYVDPELRTRESIKKRFSEVTVHTKDGRVFKKKISTPSGSPENPLADDQLEEKFRDCSKSILAKGYSDRVISLVYAMQNLEDIEELMDIIVFKTE